MKNKISILLFTFFYLLFFVQIASAFSLESGPEINFSGDQIIEENVYLVGGNVYFDKTLENDVLVVAGKSNINGVVFGDLQIYSGDVIFNGEAFGDSRFLGGNVTIKGNTNKDLVIVSGKTLIENNAILNGETLIISGEVDLKGKILDDLKIIAGKVNISDAEILGDVEITTQQLNINDSVKVEGDFVYFSPKRASVSSGATIKNKFVYNQIESIDENVLVKKTVLNFINFWSVIKFLATLFTAFILVFVFRMFSQRTSNIAVKKLGKSFFIGLLSILLVPIFTVILAMSLFALPIAGILFLMYFIVFILTAPVSGIIAGHYIKKLIKKENKVEIDFNFTTLGIIILTFVYFIPFVGSIIKTLLFILTFGAIVLHYFEIITIKKEK